MPEYEINSQTVEYLYQIALENEAREREAEVMVADMEQKAEEYSSEGGHWYRGWSSVVQ